MGLVLLVVSGWERDAGSAVKGKSVAVQCGSERLLSESMSHDQEAG